MTIVAAMIGCLTAATGALVGIFIGRPIGWWLFRVTHRHNPTALAWAQSRTVKTSGNLIIETGRGGTPVDD